MGRGGPATKAPPSLPRSVVFRFPRSLAVNRIPTGPERLLGVSLMSVTSIYYLSVYGYSSETHVRHVFRICSNSAYKKVCKTLAQW